ncbi:MAG: efflux RND transporter periplasmic adaptor subunit [candidate division WOR-3 bacterium]
MRCSVPLAFLFLLACGRKEDVILLSGTVEVKEVRVSPEIAGKIERMNFQKGDSVREGDVLFSLDTFLLARNLASVQSQSQAMLSQASAISAQIAQLDKDIKRAEELFGEGAVSQQALEQMRSTRMALVRQRSALLSQAQALSAQGEMTMEQVKRAAEVRSPISGVILDKRAEPGEMVLPGSAVYLVGVLDSPYVRVYLPEKYIGKVRIGTQARVKTDAFPDEFKGKVVFISQKAEFTPKEIITPEERTTRVFELHVLVEGARLYPGMYADVILQP